MRRFRSRYPFDPPAARLCRTLARTAEVYNQFMSTNPLVPLDSVAAAAQERQATPISRRPPAEEIAAWALLTVLLVFVLIEHLVSAAIVTLALYSILEGVSKRISRWLSGSMARPLAVLIVTAVTAAVVTGIVALTVTM